VNENTKKKLSFFTALLLVMSIMLSSLSVFPEKAHAFAGGKGTEAEPYIIKTASHLKNVKNNLRAYYKLGADISIKYDIWAPIGDRDYPFQGGFDGDGYTITGLTISRPQYNYNGLFGFVSTDGYIRNLHLTDVNVVGVDITGSLVGYTDKGAIENVHASGTVKGEDQVGGLIGYMERTSTLVSSSANVKVNGIQHVGGLVGRFDSYTSMDANFATGDVSATGSNVGGLIGYLETNGGVHDSYATGNITGTTGDIGGLIGYNIAGAIEYTYATGNITALGGSYIGGLIGQNDLGNVSKSYATGNITIKNSSYLTAGGFIGNINGGKIHNNYATGNVIYEGTATGTFIGGFTGSNTGSTVQIVNGYAAGKVVGTGDSNGGFVGIGTGSNITSSYYDTEVAEMSDTGKGAPQTTSEMQTASTFINWDFDNIWSIKEGLEYPKLRPYIRQYKVTYDGNNHSFGVAPTDSTTYPEGELVTVLGNSGDLTKYYTVFGGWNTKADGTGITYQAGDTFTIGSGHVKLYAKWDPVTNAGPAIITTQPADHTVYVNDPVTLSVQATGSGTVSYQWYQADDANRTHGDTIMVGQTGSSLIVDTSEIGRTFYFAEVTNYDPSKNGINTVTITTRVAEVVVLSPNETSTEVVSSQNPSTDGQLVTFTATVSKPSYLSDTPTGTITFKDGKTTLGTAPLTVGQATYSTSSLSLGSHSITAVYSGSGKYSASTSAPLTQTVMEVATGSKLVTATSVSSNQNPSVEGQVVSFTASIYGDAGIPTGTVTFKNGNIILDTVNMADGSATYSTASLGAGAHSITASYNGDQQYESSTSAPFTQTVTALPITPPTTPTEGSDGDSGSGGSSDGNSGGSTPAPTTPPATPKPAVPTDSDDYQDPNDIFRSRVVNADSNVIAGVEARTAEILLKGDELVTLEYDDVDQHWSLPSVKKLTQLGVLTGYPDGGFEPDEQITRAEFAAMIDRAFVDMADRKVTLNEDEWVEFSDINGHWSSSYLKRLVAVGVLNGYEDGTIRPEQTISRQEMALIITRVLNAYILNRDTSEVQFTDLDQAFGADAIKKATALGIFTGKTVQTFDPNGGATRAESIQTIISTYRLSPAITEALNSLN